MRHFKFTLLVSIMMFCYTNAQVGIGTTTPENSSILDITATDKGVLVPRINLLDVTNVVAPINAPATGLLVWNTNATVTGGNGVGFYFFNGAQWLPIQQSGSIDADFYEQGSTNPPDDINDNTYTFGNLAIGSNAPGFRLDVTENTAPTTFYNRNGFNLGGPVTGIFNSVSGVLPSDADTQRGIYNLMSGSGDNLKYGIYNNMNDTGNSQRYGTYNTIIEDADKPQYGTYNTISSSPSTITSTRFGTYNGINNTNDATNYGVYNQITGSSSSWQYGTYNWIINSNASNTRNLTGTFNSLQGTGNTEQFGVYNQFNTGDGPKLAVFNDLNFNGDGNRYGMRNDIGGTGNGNHYGIDNIISGTGTGNKYGVNVNILNSAGGTHYGVFSNVTKAGSFAGFYLGALSVGTTNANNYVFPASRGTANQIMQTDGAGNVSWVDASSVGDDDHDFYEEGTTTAPDDINDDQYTLGNLAIGKNTADWRLEVEEPNGGRGISVAMTGSANTTTYGILSEVTNSSDATHIGVFGRVLSNGDGAQRGFNSYINGGGTGAHYGLYNTLSGGGAGEQFGVRTIINNQGSAEHYGAYNSLVGNGTGDQYGVYNDINNTSNGDHFGVYNNLVTSGTGQKYGNATIISGSGTAFMYGTYNNIGGTATGRVHGTTNLIINDNNNLQYAVANSLAGDGSGMHYGMHNSFTGTGNGDKFGVYNDLISAGSGIHYGAYNYLRGAGTGSKIGTYNDISNNGAAVHYGLQNEFTGNSADKRGVYNNFGQGGSSNRYGLYNFFDSANSLSPVDHGVFTVMTGDSPSNQYGMYQAIHNSGAGQHYGIHNYMLNGQGNQYGLHNDMTIANSVDGIGNWNQMYGNSSASIIAIDNDMNGSASFFKGVDNDFTNSEGLSLTGVENRFNNTNASVTDNFGMLSEFANGSAGTQYGAYNGFVNALGPTYGIYNNVAGGTQEFNGVYNYMNSFYGNKYGVNSYFNSTDTSANSYGAYNVFVGDANARTGLSNSFYQYFDTISEQYGVHNNFEMNGSFSTTSIGVNNQFVYNISAPLNPIPSSDYVVGVYNNLELPALANANFYGVKNVIDASVGSPTSNVYGVFNEMLTTGTNSSYGVYSDNSVNTTGNHFAAYFLGKVSFGTTIANSYVFPLTRGTNGQIIQTDGTGNLSWADVPSTSFWTRTGNVLNLANAGDDITFVNDQTSITFPASNGTPAPMLYMFSSGFNNANKMVLAHSTTYANYGIQYDDADDAFRFLSNGIERVKIDLVGGPTVSVTGNMAVIGDIITDVTTYPDYVFESYYTGKSALNNSYSFKSLEEIERFIMAHGHLPNVKSYEEVKANGMNISVGEMTVTNLEKIEEAYLYMIELKKENDRLKAKLESQQKDIDEIKALLKQKQ
ncbi:beta strand repeat-containing protein [Psychroserpens sp. BH13MA-6]